MLLYFSYSLLFHIYRLLRGRWIFATVQQLSRDTLTNPPCICLCVCCRHHHLKTPRTYQFHHHLHPGPGRYNASPQPAAVSIARALGTRPFGPTTCTYISTSMRKSKSTYYSSLGVFFVLFLPSLTSSLLFTDPPFHPIPLVEFSSVVAHVAAVVRNGNGGLHHVYHE